MFSDQSSSELSVEGCSNVMPTVCGGKIVVVFRCCFLRLTLCQGVVGRIPFSAVQTDNTVSVEDEKLANRL
jgi:hypothetical protein